ncbi:MAG: hypothetical protein AAFY56_20320 [Pseudomonadota bacterium]
MASLGVAAISLAQVSVTYFKLRSLDHHLPLLAASVLANESWISRRMIDFELRRRILNGDFNGPLVLADTVSMVSSDEFRDQAKQRAAWLVDGLVDINSGTHNPLRGAIVGNDVPAIEYLLQLGADPRLRVGREGEDPMDALEFAKFAQSVFPDKDMSAVFAVLQISEDAE